jgi:fructose-bisphosphate aldolase class II
VSGLAGAVQHGASTLPDELFHRFPAVETAEIHLATGFQNLLYEHPAFPDWLHREIEAWCFANAADERKPGQTDEQFIYTTRKKALGPFKRQLWDLETKDEILAAQRRKISYLFTELRVNDSREMVDRYVHPVEVHRAIPEALRAAVAAG